MNPQLQLFSITCISAIGYSMGMTPAGSIATGITIHGSRALASHLTDGYSFPVFTLSQLAAIAGGIKLVTAISRIAEIPLYSSVAAPDVAASSVVASTIVSGSLAVIAPCVALAAITTAGTVKLIVWRTPGEKEAQPLIFTALAVAAVSSFITVASGISFVDNLVKA